MSTSPSPRVRELLSALGTPEPGHPLLVRGTPEAVDVLVAHVAVHEVQAARRLAVVSLADTVESVRGHHDEVVRAGLGLAGEERVSAQLALERGRRLLSWQGRTLSATDLSDHLEAVARHEGFTPDTVIVEGLPGDRLDSLGVELAAWSRREQRVLWICAAEDHAALPASLEPHGVLRLEPDGHSTVLHHSEGRSADVTKLPWRLDPEHLTLTTGDGGQVAAALDPATCTMHTGGAGGSEAAFGALAEAWGLREVAFSFDGHTQARTVGRVELSGPELEAGDVSLVFVSRKLHRTYNRQGLVRKVLQTLWHMVSRSQQVFVVGAIQDDDTVVGGTGWGVELARMWQKEVWVYDQDRRGWFEWTGDAWTAGTPRITSTLLCGTGTRSLEPHAHEALERLFEKAFGPRP